MIRARTFPRSLSELEEIVATSAGDSTRLAMQAGHFLLYYDVVEDRIIPCIAEALLSPRHRLIRKEAGGFPGLSWQLGLHLLQRHDHAHRSIMIVVNDWQYLPKGIDRRRFYEASSQVPQGYLEGLQKAGDAVKMITPASESGTGPFFGEMNLRNQYRKSVEKLIRAGKLPTGATVEHVDGEVVCNLPDTVGRSHEVYCSNKTGDCAAEIAQMLAVAREKTACDCFINLYPAVCRDFVERGTELGEQLLSNGIKTVLNVGFPTGGVQSVDDLMSACEVTVHDFS